MNQSAICLTFKNTPTYNDSTLRTIYSNLQINVAHLLKSPSGSSASYLIDESIGKDEIEHICGDIILTRTGHGIMVKGKITANTTVMCSRCMKNANYTTVFDVEEEFLPEAYISSHITKSDDFDTSSTINSDNVLDLSEIIRQCVLLSIPIKPLCKPDCAGLCVLCGQNLNQGTCVCSANTNSEPAINITTTSHTTERRTT